MKLEEQLAAVRADFARNTPADRAAVYEAKLEEIRASFVSETAVGVGHKAPGFDLPGIDGRRLMLDDILRQGSVVLTFYRGGWCPYCNIQLRAYQAILPQITALGGRLVAVSPQLPDGSLSTAEKNSLTFDVLSDVGNEVAHRYGLVFTLPAELRDAMRASNKALPAINGDDSWELPVPATFVVGRDGRVAFASLDIDHRARPEPEAVLEGLRAAQL